MTDRRAPHQMMTEAQYRDFNEQRLNQGEEQFEQIMKMLELTNKAIQDHAHATHEEFSAQNKEIAKNTAITRAAMRLAKKASEQVDKLSVDTSNLVALDRFVRAGATSVVAGAKAVDQGVQHNVVRMTKWAVFIGIIVAIFHGQLPSWKDIVEIAKK